MTNNTNEKQIRKVISDWEKAIQEGDIEEILANHTDDCNTSNLSGHFVVVSKLQTGGLYAQRSQGRIEGKAQANRT